MSQANKSASASESKNDDGGADSDDEAEGETYTLFVKNLNFDTTDGMLMVVVDWYYQHSPSKSDYQRFTLLTSYVFISDTLKKVFEKAGALRSARVAKKKDVKNKGKMLSMGFGFVEYVTKEGANNALKTLQGTRIDGHVLELKLARNTATRAGGREQTVCVSLTYIYAILRVIRRVVIHSLYRLYGIYFSSFILVVILNT